MENLKTHKREIKMKIPKNAVKVHLYNIENVLRPRGHMKKESVSEYIMDRLMGAFESWSDDQHGDNPEIDTLLRLLQKNLKEEVDGAWIEFLKRIKTLNKE